MATISEAFADAVRHCQAGRREIAESVCQQILAVDPQHWQAWHLSGVIARDAGRSEDAVHYFERAVAANPSHPTVRYDLGGACLALRRFEEAIACYQAVVALQPEFADAHNNLGVAWSARGMPERARPCFERAVELKPGNAAGHNNLGILYKNEGDFERAVACCRQALELRPDFVQACNNLGNALLELGKREEAIASCRRGIELQANYPDTHVTLGNCLKDQGQLDEAIACYERALALNPHLAVAHNNLGSVFKDQGRLDDAITSFRRAMQFGPDSPAYHSNFIYTLHFHPQSSARTLFEEHREWHLKHAAHLEQRIQPHQNDRSPGRRLRIGYLSPDLRSHSVGRFLLPLLEAHDREKFEIFCYSTVRKPDPVTERCRRLSDAWRNVLGQSDEQIAGGIRSDRIDILVDLTMHMENNRLLVFARKPAPVQVTYLAYCSTTGLGAIDYRLTDPHLDLPGCDESFYSERSLRLPLSYWCYQPISLIEPGPLPALNEGHLTFGCLNNFCKVTAPALSAWARILMARPQARLVLHARPGSHCDRVYDFFAGQGVSRERLSFVDRLPADEYFRLYQKIDVALDPFPYGGGITTCDALWMGVPVVSLAGPTAVCRGGLSILSNLGLRDLVAADVAQYEQIAVKLSGDLSRMQMLRATLRDRMRASPLLDAPRFARDVESTYREMWGHWCADPAAQ